jgi:protein TonB
MNILIIIGAVTLVSILLSLGQGWSSVLNSDRNNLVFENKNHSYGAYQLRRGYDRRLAFSMMLVVLITAGAAIAANKFSSKSVLQKEVKVDIDIPDIIIDPFTTEVVILPPQIELPHDQERVINPPSSSSASAGGIIEVVEDLIVAPTPIIVPGTPGVEPSTGKEGPGLVGTGSGGDTSSLLGSAPEDNEVVVYAPIMPEYPGGEPALMDDMYSFVKYPEIARDKGKEGIVHVSFIIEKDGSISDVRAVKEIPGAPELSREAERCVKKLKKFKPAMMGKNPVRLRTVLPIHFKLN